MNNRQEQIEQARRLIATGISEDLVEVLHQQFPELKESEDERIRRTLIHIVKGACDKYGIKYKGDEITEEKLLAYLEKQKDFQFGYPGIYFYDGEKLHFQGNPAMEEKQKEQKPAEWSEEDEKNWNAYIERLKSEFNKTPNVVLWDDINWLEALHERFKSLHPQPHWKPSEEQMKSLSTAYRLGKLGKTDMESLQSLYEQLKKL